MLSQDELLGIIATEALEGPASREKYIPHHPIKTRSLNDSSPNPLSFEYNLRLVRYDDGRLEWEE